MVTAKDSGSRNQKEHREEDEEDVYKYRECGRKTNENSQFPLFVKIR